MGKKTKGKSLSSSTRSQANAPEYHQMLHQPQPAHNPYYPDPASVHTPTSVPPPPYTATTVSISTNAARNTVPMSDIQYPRIQSGQQSSRVVIQAPSVPYNYREERYRHKIRSFNGQTLVFAILSIILAVWAHSLYNQRPCVDEFVVHKIDKDFTVKHKDIREAHLSVAFASGGLVLICLLKSMIGFNGKSHPCYLFIIALYTLAVTIFLAYLTYLVMFSPCATLGDAATGLFKTIASKLSDKLPDPERGFFGESNLIEKMKEDSKGFGIFLMDMMNVILYFSIFLSSTLLC